MGGPSEAGDVLRRHVIERHMRVAIQSVNIDHDPRSNVPRMSNSQFVDSCLLVKGVPEMTLLMLEAWVTGSMGSTWTVDAVEIRGKLVNVPVEQLAQRITLREAAARVGMDLSFGQARELYRKAMSIVTDNLVGRTGRYD